MIVSLMSEKFYTNCWIKRNKNKENISLILENFSQSIIQPL